MDENSNNFSKIHTRTFYGDAPKLKVSREKFQNNSYYAHLIGRAFSCELLIKKHQAEPYQSVDELLGDIQIEMTECLNYFRDKGATRTMPKYKVEDFIQ